MHFADRRDAGRQLADALAHVPLHEPVVLALPRGGVPVGFEVARRLRAPLEVFVVRKVGAPGHVEFGIGAIAEGGTVLFDPRAVQALGLGDDTLDELLRAEQGELDRRVRDYRGGRELPALAGHDVVVVDDGIATGVTAEAAVRAVRAMGPRRVTLAVPVCPPDSRDRLAQIADDVVCVLTPPDLRAVGLWYERFDQTTDEEVAALLAAARTGEAIGT
jgi:putative phosphoribosyl transferase